MKSIRPVILGLITLSWISSAGCNGPASGTLNSQKSFTNSGDNSDCSQAVAMDLFHVVSNSLRAPPARQNVNADMLQQVADLSAAGIDLQRVVALPWDISHFSSWYAQRELAGKFIVLYVNDDNEPLMNALCDDQNLNSGCHDQAFADIQAELNSWVTDAPRLIVQVHFHHKVPVSREVLVYDFLGQNLLDPNKSFEETINDFTSQSQALQCDQGPVIGV